MVPLPLHAQFRVNESIIRRQILLLIRLAYIGFLIRCPVFRHILPVLADDRPSVHPLHRLQIGDASNCTGIPEYHGPPFARLGLNQCSLVDATITEDTVITLLIRSHRVLRTENGLRSLRVISGIDVVVVTDMVHVAAFTTSLHTDGLGT